MRMIRVTTGRIRGIMIWETNNVNILSDDWAGRSDTYCPHLTNRSTGAADPAGIKGKADGRPPG